jgi:hypothetical protein
VCSAANKKASASATTSAAIKAALAVGVQDPRRGNLYPQVVGMSGRVQRVQRPACAMRCDGNGLLAASSNHAEIDQRRILPYGSPGRRETWMIQILPRRDRPMTRPDVGGPQAAFFSAFLRWLGAARCSLTPYATAFEPMRPLRRPSYEAERRARGRLARAWRAWRGE